MSRQEDKSPPDTSDLTDQVIDDLYEVAIDPTRYEALLDHWEAMMAPQRATANGDDLPSMPLPEFEDHFRRADRVLVRVTGPDGGGGTDPDALLARAGRAAAFAVDSAMTVKLLNPAAALSLGVTMGAAITDMALAEGEAEEIGALVRRMLQSNAAEPAVVRVRTRRDDRMMLIHLRVIRPNDAPAYVFALTSELGWPEGFTDLLRGAFDLTPAEVAVMRALAEGRPLADIAAVRKRSIETIRAQIKALLAKTGTRSQTELVRLTLATMEMAQYSDAASDGLSANSTGMGTLEPRPFRTLTLPDGRRHDYLVLGDPTGRPCLFLPLDYGLIRWPASAEAEAARRGLKLIVPVRPGYGASTSLPKQVPYNAQLAADTIAILDHEGAGRVPIVSLGGDSYLSYTLHAAYPERVEQLICCGGALPLTRPSQYDRMDKWHRFILAGARYTPHLLPFMVKAGFALAHRLGKRGFVHAVYGKSAADVATFEIPEVFEAMVCGSEVALSDTHSAHDAFSREVISHETSDWTAELETLRQAVVRAKDDPRHVPVTFLNGLQDPQVPRDTLMEQQADYPWIRFRIYPDAGQLVFLLKWRDVIDLLDPGVTNP